MSETVYISIGNSDDKLTQREWAEFVGVVEEALDDVYIKKHGSWFSRPDASWQNACWCIELEAVAGLKDSLQTELEQIAREFRQDSIAWAEAITTFLGAEQ